LRSLFATNSTFIVETREHVTCTIFNTENRSNCTIYIHKLQVNNPNWNHRMPWYLFHCKTFYLRWIT